MVQRIFSTMPRVAAVIVTFRPDLDRLKQLLAAVEKQVQFSVVVDNGSPTENVMRIRQCLADSQHLIALGENKGIAAAQNVGLAYARDHRADYVLLLDQDSAPADGMVEQLLSYFSALSNAGRKVAAIGPRLADERWKSEQRLKPKGREQEVANLLEVDHIIASGSVIPMEVIGAVGGMKDELFIDNVDIEWCLRASRHGYTSFIATNVIMDHQLGEPMNVMGRIIPTHSPMRHYYMVRNTVWLARQPWLSSRWRYVKVPKIALHLSINAVFARPHREHWRMMLRGLHHGLKGRMGKGHE
jgi:rhamnosyltransferase